MARTLTPMIPDAPLLVFKSSDAPEIDRSKSIPEHLIDRSTRYQYPPPLPFEPFNKNKRNEPEPSATPIAQNTRAKRGKKQ